MEVLRYRYSQTVAGQVGSLRAKRGVHMSSRKCANPVKDGVGGKLCKIGRTTLPARTAGCQQAVPLLGCRNSAGRFRCWASQTASNVGLFPAGQQQAKVDLPALMVRVDAASVLNSPDILEEVNSAVAAGATAVIMECNTADGQLYDAAVKLRDMLRQRSALLVQDRNDIANYVSAEGVVLSSGGVPVAAARKLLQGRAALIGQLVDDPGAAAAAAADGANFVLLQSPGGAPVSPLDVAAARQQQRSGNPIPVIASATTLSGSPGGGLAPLAGPADGFALPLGLLQAAAAAVQAAGVTGEPASLPAPATLAAQVGTLLQALTNADSTAAAAAGTPAGAPPEAEAAAAGAGRGAVKVKVPGEVGGNALRRLMDSSKEALLADEKELLAEVLSLLEVVVPEMDELQLLRTSLAALDDVFMVVVVGEFNSGKSTVINALLGEKFLTEGVLPTTNEISVLKYADPSMELPGGERLEQRADGLFWRYLPAELLKEMNIVDTPGKNVSIERQERLTEEFVPQADLVLFVMSADRVFSKSEVEFLEYIQQWKKKIVFVINKVDTCQTPEEVAQLEGFAIKNARELLKLEAPVVLPVSGAQALRAKLACGSGRQGGILDSWEDDLLQDQAAWRDSRFGAFERFIYEFLVGSGENRMSGEGLRLKLQTPLNIGDALMGAAARVLEGQIAVAESELAALEAVKSQLARFQTEMSKDSAAQRQVIKDLVAEAVERNDRFVDKTLALSNLNALTAYLLGPGKGGKDGLPVAAEFDKVVVSGTFDQLAKQVNEHAGWLATNCSNQASYYATFLTQRTQPDAAASPLSQLQGTTSSNGSSSSSSSSGGSMEPPRTVSSSSTSSSSSSSSTNLVSLDPSTCSSIAAVGEFNIGAAKTLLEEELREAFLGTAGSAAGALGTGFLAASWLPNTLEDFLALSIAGLASYISVLNLPLRRSKIKGKVATISNNFATTLTQAMEQDVNAVVEATISGVLSQAQPLELAWREQLEQLRASQARCEQLLQQLQDMEKRTANI